jgi:Fe-S-cluster containining protein
MPEAETGGDGRPRRLQIEIQTAYGLIKGNLAVPPGNVRLSELASSAMAIDDRLVGLAAASEAGQGRRVSCQAGCGACCRQAVPLSPAEAFMIADVVSGMPPDRKLHTLERFAAAKETLQAHGFGDRSLQGSASEEQVLHLGLDYFRLGIACPFLVEESCSIHPNRPSACREYLVTSPAAYCSDPGAHPIRSVPSAGSLTEALSKLSAMILGGEPTVIPMTLALEWAMANREAGRERYDAAALLTALVELLSTRGPESGSALDGVDGGDLGEKPGAPD